MQQQSQSQIDMSNKIQQQQYDLTNKNAALADTYQQRMQSEFYPMQDQIVKQAENTNTAGYQEQQAESALGDTNDAFTNQRNQSNMRMQAYGIDPTSGAYNGQNNAQDVMQAASGAAAATRARQAADQLGWARMMDAQGLGSGLAGNQATSTGISLNAGNNSLASGAQGIAATNALGNSYAQGTAGAMQGWNNVGNLGVQKYGTDVSAFNAQTQANAQSSAGWGSAIGGLIGAGMNGGSGGFAKSATSIVRQLIDAGTLSNLPGGLKARGLRIKGDDTPIPPGEFRDVDVPSGTIRDNIMTLPYKEPSATLYQLLNTIVEEGRRFANTADLQITDVTTGLDRFKNGFIVDQFTGHGIGDVQNTDYRISVDTQTRQLRPMHYAQALELVELLVSGTDRATKPYQKTGDLITLPYE